MNGLHNISIKTYGYEIHMGKCSYGHKAKPLFEIYSRNGERTSYEGERASVEDERASKEGEQSSLFDGAINARENIMGTYIHGVLDGTEFREYIINKIRIKKSMEPKKSRVYESLRDKELDKLADLARENIDMDSIYKIIGIKGNDKARDS